MLLSFLLILPPFDISFSDAIKYYSCYFISLYFLEDDFVYKFS